MALELCQCVFREDGKETPFTWPYERLQELMDRCARKFTDGLDIGGPDLPAETKPVAGVRRKKSGMAS